MKMLTNKSGLVVTLAIVPLVGLISLAVGVVMGDPVARMLATGLLGYLALGVVLRAGYTTLQKVAAGRKLNWAVLLIAALGLGVLLIPR
jgi:hypothetical protein